MKELRSQAGRVKMIKYKAEGWFAPTIKKIEVERETESSVFFPDGRSERKVSNDRQYFNTFDEAKAWLIELCEREAQGLRRALEIANGRLGNAKGLKEI